MPVIKKANQVTMRNVVPAPVRESMHEVEPMDYPRSGPTIYLDVEVPELDGREVGTEVTFTGKAKLMSVKQRENKRGKKKCYSLELLEMGVE